MTALPPKVPARLQHLAHVLSAYDACLRQEKILQQAIDNGDAIGNDMIYIRILGYLVHYVPTDEGLKNVVCEISSCKADRELLDVGKFYFDHYIRAFRANRSRIPTPSDYESRPSFDTITDMINDTLKEAPQSHSTARRRALIRDGYRCVVTGKYDAGSVFQIQELEDIIESNPSLRTEVTECAHIFAESTNSSIEPGSAKRDYASSMWTVMVRFGYKELLDELNGSKVHRLDNVITVNHGFHWLFNQLAIWFVRTNEENKYKLEATRDYNLRDYPTFVTFKTHDQVNFPVPSSVYLAIHAAWAKVAHLSGATACIDKFYQDMDDCTTLDPNGASAGMLEHAIFELQAAGHPVIA